MSNVTELSTSELQEIGGGDWFEARWGIFLGTAFVAGFLGTGGFLGLAAVAGFGLVVGPSPYLF